MKRTIFLFILYTIGILGNAQNYRNDYQLDNRVVVLDVINFDSLTILRENNADCNICVEKKHVDYYIDRDSLFYIYWQLYPNSYVLADPISINGWMRQYVFPNISDSTLILELEDCFYHNDFNGIPKFSYNKWHEIYSNKKEYHNITCYDVGWGTFLVLLVPYNLYYYQDCPLLRAKGFSSGLYIKLLYPMHIY